MELCFCRGLSGIVREARAVCSHALGCSSEHPAKRWNVLVSPLLTDVQREQTNAAHRHRTPVHAGAHGSAQQNVAVSRAVGKKLAVNGWRVPEALRS
jgi:hypothetical protein